MQRLKSMLMMLLAIFETKLLIVLPQFSIMALLNFQSCFPNLGIVFLAFLKPDKIFSISRI